MRFALAYLLPQCCRLRPRAGADINYPVACGDHMQVMLHHQDRVSRRDQPVQLPQQTRHVRRMKARGWFIKNIERVPPGGSLQFRGQLDALRFPTG
jgi:hypothetical protein